MDKAEQGFAKLASIAQEELRLEKTAEEGGSGFGMLAGTAAVGAAGYGGYKMHQSNQAAKAAANAGGSLWKNLGKAGGVVGSLAGMAGMAKNFLRSQGGGSGREGLKNVVNKGKSIVDDLKFERGAAKTVTGGKPTIGQAFEARGMHQQAKANTDKAMKSGIIGNNAKRYKDAITPKPKPKASPKAKPKASPKASPKAEPKASPKAEPKAKRWEYEKLPHLKKAPKANKPTGNRATTINELNKNKKRSLYF